MRRMLLVLVVAALAFPAVASAHSVEVFPPGSKPYGKTYGQWSAEWWKQAVRETGAPGTPFASGRVDCGRLGTRDVVFLVGTAVSNPVERTCSIPRGKPLLIPVLNGECSTAEGQGFTEFTLRRCARVQADGIDVSSLHVDIGTRSIGGLGRFRFASPLFFLQFARGNVFGVKNLWPSPSVADGYYVMLAPRWIPARTRSASVGLSPRCPSPRRPPTR